MVGAHGDDLLQPLAHLSRRAVDARRIGPRRVMVHLGEPAVQLGTGNFRAIINRHEDPL